ncbi:MAG: methionyl-tRNA formyltransferase [Anaerolineae bacterium]|nr:methionyl-tRNA formyltransferase [Anaerolineae bacterium]
MLRVVFMGTPDFAVPTLKTLLTLPDVQVVGVATQPDKPAGRGRALAASPVKQVAVAAGVPVLQPRGFRKNPANAEALRALTPDLLVVAAYGLILPQSVLDIPRYGSLNVHASLLPRWRGAAPITFAILAGDAVTGVTIMLMDAGMDTGPILTTGETPIQPNDTTESLSQRLAVLGAGLLRDTLPRWVAGEIQPQPQPGDGVTLTRLIQKEDGLIDWGRPAVEIERAVRAYQPWPGAYTLWRGEPLKVLKASVVAGQGEPGRVVMVQGGVAVATGAGLLRLDEVQPAGRRPMPGKAFVNGAKDFIGSHLKEVV